MGFCSSVVEAGIQGICDISHYRREDPTIFVGLELAEVSSFSRSGRLLRRLLGMDPTQGFFHSVLQSDAVRGCQLVSLDLLQVQFSGMDLGYIFSAAKVGFKSLVLQLLNAYSFEKALVGPGFS